MTRYVVGFAFNPSRDYVLLVRKNQPAWQDGKLNGIGGKIEADESPELAMAREFEEETDTLTELDEWRYHFTLESGKHEIHFFSMQLDLFTMMALDLTPNDVDEMVELHRVDDLRMTDLKIPNLGWIVPMLAYTHDEYLPFRIQEAPQ